MNEALKQQALAVAEAMQGASDATLPADLRARFIEVRAALFTRGIYDPVLVRFDSATVPKASTREIGEQLATVAATL